MPSIVQSDQTTLPFTYLYNYFGQPAAGNYAYQQLPPPNSGSGLPQGGGYGQFMTQPPSITHLPRKSEDDPGKKVQRLLKNRMAAKASRARKKVYHDNMKNRNYELEVTCSQLEAENKQLHEKLTYLNRLYSGTPYIRQ